MEAASAASALPAEKTSTKCWALPAPPEAMTGIETDSEIPAVSSQSKPAPVPSRSMDVSRISPAPRSSASRAHASAFLCVAVRPPETKTSAEAGESVPRRASMATITACEPKRPAIAVIMPGSASAAELMLTLSAPASKTLAALSSVRMPPPTVNGTNRSFAARRTVSTNVLRPSVVAVTSSSTISSAPAVAWARANSAGSPASRSCWNWTPFTTRPASTSRQAMMRLASRSEGTEVLQDLQAGFGKFLRVKLHAEHIVPLHCGRKSAAITCACGSFVNHRRPERMRVVDKCAAVHTVQQARSCPYLNLVPANMRRFYRGRETRTLAGEERGARRFGSFRAASEEPLHAHADSKKWFAAFDGIEHGRAQVFIQRLAAAEVPDSRHNNFLCVGDYGRIGSHPRVCAQMLQRFPYRADIARTVVDNRDHSKP